MELRQCCSEIIATALMRLGPKPVVPKTQSRRSVDLPQPTGEGYDIDGDDDFDEIAEIDELDEAIEVLSQTTKRGKSKGAPSKKRVRTQQINRIVRELAMA